MTVNDRNVVLTGLPRGGATLSCNLIGEVSNTLHQTGPCTVSRFSLRGCSRSELDELLKCRNLNKLYDRDTMIREIAYKSF